MALQADGKAVVAIRVTEGSDFTFGVARFLATGAPDTG